MRIILNNCLDPQRALRLILECRIELRPGDIGGWYGEDKMHTDYRVTRKGTVSVWQYWGRK